MIQKGILFGEKKNLAGVVTIPEGEKKEIGVIVLNAGHLHRVGPNRIYVDLAHELTGAGYTVLRFDFSGIGDSIIKKDLDTFRDSAVKDTLDGIKYLANKHQLDKFILIGICSGANIAYLASASDKRIASIILINAEFIDITATPLFKKEMELNTRKRYYLKKIFSRNGWQRVMRGKSNLKNILLIVPGAVFYLLYLVIKELIYLFKLDRNRELLDNLETIYNNGTQTQIVYSEGSNTLDIYNLRVKHQINKKYFTTGQFKFTLYTNVDHTFTPLASQKRLIADVKRWIEQAAHSPITNTLILQG
jgi:alpha/beta superfamily hydrolase